MKTGGNKLNGTEIYTITATTVRHADRTYRDCLGICPDGGVGTEKFLDYMRENVKPGVNEREKEELLKMMEESRGGTSPYVEEFNSLMRELIGTLIAQACEMAALVL